VGKGGYATLIAAGAVAGLTTVVMTLLIGATRVTFAMSRDWLLPKSWGKTNPKTGTPVKITDHDRHPRRLHRGLHPDRQARGNGQHRHLVSLLPRVTGRPRVAPSAP
jgi:hypothetical protein